MVAIEFELTGQFTSKRPYLHEYNQYYTRKIYLHD